jgi:uncharacterized protein YjbI with pentapeptide repeats
LYDSNHYFGAPIDFSGEKLDGGMFIDTDFGGASMAGSRYYRTDLAGADMSGAFTKEYTKPLPTLQT